MSTLLLLDIGAGTLDLLYYDSVEGTHYKSVSRSPVLFTPEKAQSLSGNLLITGNEMGGGSLGSVLKERAKTNEVLMTASAAATINHDLRKVQSLGIKIIEDERVPELLAAGKYSHLQIGDLDMHRLRQAIDGLGVPFSFDIVGICAQDHGMPLPGMSHLDYRHKIFQDHLEQHPFPHTLLYKSDEIPHTLSRLKSIAKSARQLPADEIYVMDSGMAAILGASFDPRAVKKKNIMVLDIATSHTVGAAIEAGELNGFFEYHTRDITLERVESLLVGLADGNLDHKNIVAEGGHGAYIRKKYGFESVDIIVATGPKRSLIAGSTIPIEPGAPLGDNMMTGTVGMLEAIRRIRGLTGVFTYQ